MEFFLCSADVLEPNTMMPFDSQPPSWHNTPISQPSPHNNHHCGFEHTYIPYVPSRGNDEKYRPTTVREAPQLNSYREDSWSQLPNIPNSQYCLREPQQSNEKYEPQQNVAYFSTNQFIDVKTNHQDRPVCTVGSAIFLGSTGSPSQYHGHIGHKLKTDRQSLPSSSDNASTCRRDESALRNATDTKNGMLHQPVQQRDQGDAHAARGRTATIVTAEDSKKRKGDDADIQLIEPAPKRQVPNIFTKMMKASQELETRTNPPVDFPGWTEWLDNLLEEQNFLRNGAYQWVVHVENSIIEAINVVILPHLRVAPHINTKLNALCLMMEIAMAVAYTPRGTIPDLVRKQNIPPFLMNEMFKIVQSMSASEMKKLAENQIFWRMLKELRQQPLVAWEGNTWNGLDEILRVAKDPGPVDFRRIVDGIKDIVWRPCKVPRKEIALVVKAIRIDIAAYVSAGSCFETKYNALNALVDAGILLWPIIFDREEDRKLALEALTSSLMAVGRMFNAAEIDRIVAEMKTEPELSAPGFLDDFRTRKESKWPMGGDYPYDYNSRAHGQYILGMIMGQMKSKEGSDYGKSGLLFKLLYLGYHDHDYVRHPEAFKARIDEVLDLFPDRTVPLRSDLLLDPVDRSFFNALSSYSYDHYYGFNDKAVVFRESIDQAVLRISKYASQTCSLAMKISALNILCEIGLRILEWMHASQPTWNATIFEDHLSEDGVTDGMMNILHPLPPGDWKRAMEDNIFADNIRELEARRSLLPDVLEGMDGVMRIVTNPKHLVSREVRREQVLATVKTEVAIDLTDSQAM